MSARRHGTSAVHNQHSSNSRGHVLDVGCGRGEHALMAAAMGLDANGIDAAPAAIASAQRKARERGLSARFVVDNALDLASLDEHFDTVFDCGLFHIFEDDDRPVFVDRLRAVTAARRALLHAVLQRPGAWRLGTAARHRARNTGTVPRRMAHRRSRPGHDRNHHRSPRRTRMARHHHPDLTAGAEAHSSIA